MDQMKRIIHLHNRAAFGLPFHRKTDGSPQNHLDELIKESGSNIDLKVTGAGQLTPVELQRLTPEKRKEAFRVKQEEMRALNIAWLKQMAFTGAPLREKLSFFWHGHFACRNGIPLFMENMVNMIRRNALSSFRTLLHDVSRSPAMLQFLSNQQNRKASPNENFARELLELFTLGRGNYTESDIKAAARAFTGWGFDEEGNFEFRSHQHDFGEKEFLGKKGNWNGDDIINIILENRQCAIYIAGRFCRYFVSEKADDEKISEVAARFYSADYSMPVLVRSVFGSDWFYNEEFISNNIKSPVELLVPLIRDFKLDFKNPTLPFTLQRIMGQVLLFPPNVGGWPGGRSWIDGASLTYRMRLPRLLLANEISGISEKDDGDDNGFKKTEFKNERLNVLSDWQGLMDVLENHPEQESGKVLNMRLTAGIPFQPETALKYAGSPDRNQYIKSFALHLMTLPEYQLC